MLLNIYVAFWIGNVLIWLSGFARKKCGSFLLSKDYFHSLDRSWKLWTFFIALALLSYVSTLGYDPTWDVPETFVMGILTYITAPYSVGTFYRFFKGLDRNWSELYLAVVLTFFSSCWFYDAYATIFLVGEYPRMAFSNMGISPILYLLGGTLWSLEYVNQMGITLPFAHKDWKLTGYEVGEFQKFLPYIAGVTVVMLAIFGYFILASSDMEP